MNRESAQHDSKHQTTRNLEQLSGTRAVMVAGMWGPGFESMWEVDFDSMWEAGPDSEFG